MQNPGILSIIKGLNASVLACAMWVCASLALLASPASAHAATLTFADLADLADPADAIVRAQIRKQAVVEPERSPGLRPGWVRLYVEARTGELLAGGEPLGESLRYLVDVPLASDGSVPKIKGDTVLLFGYRVPGRPNELQLVAPDAQLPATEETESRLRALLSEMYAPGAPPRITGIRDVLWVEGNLAGESETQLFLESKEGPVLVSVFRQPGERPAWSVSFSELVDQAARPPAPNTLAWYRLACTLPPYLPQRAHLSQDRTARTQAEVDYALIKSELGPCLRARR